MEEQTKVEVKEEQQKIQCAVISDGMDGDIVQISDTVLNTIIKKYTLDVDGVVRFQSQSLVDGMLDILGRRSGDRSVIIEHKDEGALLTLTLILRFGAVIPEVCRNVQQVLREKVKELTGYAVIGVNITVSDLEEPAPVKAEGEAEELKDGDAIVPMLM